MTFLRPKPCDFCLPAACLILLISNCLTPNPAQKEGVLNSYGGQINFPFPGAAQSGAPIEEAGYKLTPQVAVEPGEYMVSMVPSYGGDYVSSSVTIPAKVENLPVVSSSSFLFGSLPGNAGTFSWHIPSVQGDLPADTSVRVRIRTASKVEGESEAFLQISNIPLNVDTVYFPLDEVLELHARSADGRFFVMVELRADEGRTRTRSASMECEFVEELVRFQPVNPAGNYPKSGDIAPFGYGDGIIDTGDAVVALRCAVGDLEVTTDIVEWGDVAPLMEVGLGYESRPDGYLTVGDAVVLLRAGVGMVSWREMAPLPGQEKYLTVTCYGDGVPDVYGFDLDLYIGMGIQEPSEEQESAFFAQFPESANVEWKYDEMTGVLHVGYMDANPFGGATGRGLFALPVLSGIDPGQVRLLSETPGYGFYDGLGNVLANVSANMSITTRLSTQ